MFDFGKMLLFVFACIVLAAAFLLIAWLVKFQGAFLIPRAMLELNPFGFFGIIAILVFGGIYLLKAAFVVFQDFSRGG